MWASFVQGDKQNDTVQYKTPFVKTSFIFLYCSGAAS